MVAATPSDFSRHLRDTLEASKYGSINRLVLAIRAIYGEGAISKSTIKRILYQRDYRPRNRRPYHQLKHVLPALQLPEA